MARAFFSSCCYKSKSYPNFSWASHTKRMLHHADNNIRTFQSIYSYEIVLLFFFLFSFVRMFFYSRRFTRRERRKRRRRKHKNVLILWFLYMFTFKLAWIEEIITVIIWINLNIINKNKIKSNCYRQQQKTPHINAIKTIERHDVVVLSSFWRH